MFVVCLFMRVRARARACFFIETILKKQYRHYQIKGMKYFDRFFVNLTEPTVFGYIFIE
jgi:hypothetical protein